MLRLVVSNYEEENETIDNGGTCDYCMGQTDVYSARWTFRDVDTDETVSFKAQEWTLGDRVLTMPQCSNIPAFSQWLSTSASAQTILETYRVQGLNRDAVEHLLYASGYIKEEG